MRDIVVVDVQWTFLDTIHGILRITIDRLDLRVDEQEESEMIDELNYILNKLGAAVEMSSSGLHVMKYLGSILGNAEARDVSTEWHFLAELMSIFVPQ